MTDLGLTLLVLPQQASERIDFDLEPGVVLVAALAFVLINLLIAAALYPYLQSGSSEQQKPRPDGTARGETVDEMASASEDELEDRVDDFLEDIEKRG